MSKSETSATLNKIIKTCDLGDASATCFSINKENRPIDNEQTVDEMTVTRSPKLKIKKMDESKHLEQTFQNVSNKIINYMENSKLSTANDAFMEFIKIEFENVPENERTIRRKLIIDAISKPLSEINYL